MEILVTAIVGMIGIRPTIEAIKAGKDIALANKETLVTAGHIIMPLAREMSACRFCRWTVSTVPFSSPCRENTHGGVHKILLTASGGPFRGMKQEDLLEHYSVEDALKHPNWAMGQKDHH